MSALRQGAIDRVIDGEDDLSVFVWLVYELEWFEAEREADADASMKAAAAVTTSSKRANVPRRSVRSGEASRYVNLAQQVSF
jgi:hypothetical protein